MSARPNWESLRRLFEGALERSPNDRSAFLREHAGDDEIRREIESLLAAHGEADGFLKNPPLGPVRRNASLIGAPRLSAGSRLGAFEIVDLLGAGGMGEVYRARDTRLDRSVAIKVLSSTFDPAPRGRERFEREARAISKLSHPHICTVYDVGAADVGGEEVPFLVLELLDGETLADRLARGPLLLKEAVTYAVDIAEALASAHAQGVVHRDLKPSNVMVTRSGVKLLDFGLAQLRAPEGGSEGASATQFKDSLTSAGRVMGTLPYMSPEQVEGRRVDARSDIFSFGSLLYEMLAGRRAFSVDSDRPVIAQILSDDPTPVSQLAPSVPTSLAEIVSRCLRKDPARRYQHMADVKVALEDVQEESRSRPQAQPWHTRTRLRWASMMLLVAVTLTGGYLAWQRQARPDGGPPPREVQLTTLHGAEASPTLAPDGEQVAFAWSGPNQDNPDIYIQRIGSGTELRRTFHPAWDFSPAWSPDGRWIAFLRGEVPGRSEVMLIPPLGGAERLLGAIHIRQSQIYPPYLSWLPDSRALVVVNSASPREPEALFVISVDTGEQHALTMPRLSDSVQQPSVSPDGRTVAFKSGASLCLLGLTQDLRASSQPRVLAQRRGFVAPTWTPDGKEIIFSEGQRLWRLDAAGTVPATPILFAGQNAIMPVISRPVAGKPSRMVYVQRRGDPNLWRLDLPALATPTSSAPVLFGSSTQVDYNAQFSPDGQRVAFQSSRGGDMQVWVADADGANPVQLTAMGASNTGTPRWSPDGQTIAFDSNAEWQYEVYVVSAGGGKPRRITFDPTEDHVPSFSRDGNFLYFSSRRSGAFEIWKSPLSGGKAEQVTRNGGFVAFESFDGRHLYYTQTANGPSTLWRIPTAGGEPERVLEGVSNRAFEVLEKGIYYVDGLGTSRSEWGFLHGMGFFGQGNRARLRFFEFASATSRVVADLNERVGLGLGATPDGRTIVFTSLDNPTSDLMMIENFR